MNKLTIDKRHFLVGCWSLHEPSLTRALWYLEQASNWKLEYILILSVLDRKVAGGLPMYIISRGPCGPELEFKCDKSLDKR